MANFSRRKFLRGVAGTGIALGIPHPALHAVTQAYAPAGSTTSSDPYALVDPELVPLLKTLVPVASASAIASEHRLLAPPPLPAPAPQPFERYIQGPAGAPNVRLVIVDPAPKTDGKPAFLHMHGGGFTGGKAGRDPDFLQRIAENCGCYVVSVDYRLAPETPFPGALEDNYEALRWLYTNAGSLGVDRKRISVGGESAGGGHAAMLAIAARDRNEIPIKFQLLIYPMLDDRTGSSRPVPPRIGNFIWTAKDNRRGWTSLLGEPAGSAAVPPGAVPARVGNLAGLPPTFIAVGSIDLFVDEDINYANRLIDACIPTELHVFPGAYHGFDLLNPQAGVTKRFTELWTSALRRALVSS